MQLPSYMKQEVSGNRNGLSSNSHMRQMEGGRFTKSWSKTMRTFNDSHSYALIWDRDEGSQVYRWKYAVNIQRRQRSVRHYDYTWLHHVERGIKWFHKNEWWLVLVTMLDKPHDMWRKDWGKDSEHHKQSGLRNLKC